MATRSRRNDDDSDQQRRPARASSGLPIVPILAILLLIAAAVYIGKAAQKDPKKESVAAETSDEYVPFSSVPDEAPPDLSARGDRTGIRAADALLQDANWLSAKTEADLGYELAELSKAANKAGNTSEYQKQAGLAHDKFSEAVSMTAVWEAALIEKHGDGDPVVKVIRKTRDRWFSQMRKLRAQAK